uniref:Uncharacterized protein n=1 Tax=candidate division WOR-3 bacterium TaxID=2052148 RepID=A0A7C3UQ22_UNCW3
MLNDKIWYLPGIFFYFCWPGRGHPKEIQLPIGGKATSIDKEQFPDFFSLTIISLIIARFIFWEVMTLEMLFYARE